MKNKICPAFLILVFISLAFTGCDRSLAIATPESAELPTQVQGVKPSQSASDISPTLLTTFVPVEPGILSTVGKPPSPTPIPTTTPTLSLDAWMNMPVIPSLSSRAIDIYRTGLQMGANPHAFSKVGDCEARTTWFLADFDSASTSYDLGEYTYLTDTIDYFSGSFGRLSLVAKPGFTAASVLVPLWSDPAICNDNETPLDCEYRLNNPSISLIMLGTNDIANPGSFESNLRAILDVTIARGILPVLVTKADNLEGDFNINSTIARLAYEYDIPLWNFWLAVQSLPNQGLNPDGAHLTWATNDFSDPSHMQEAWPVRNLNALQVLDEIRKTVTSLEH
jgi:hypothetical protein